MAFPPLPISSDLVLHLCSWFEAPAPLGKELKAAFDDFSRTPPGGATTTASALWQCTLRDVVDPHSTKGYAEKTEIASLVAPFVANRLNETSPNWLEACIIANNVPELEALLNFANLCRVGFGPPLLFLTKMKQEAAGLERALDTLESDGLTLAIWMKHHKCADLLHERVGTLAYSCNRALMAAVLANSPADVDHILNKHEHAESINVPVDFGPWRLAYDRPLALTMVSDMHHTIATTKDLRGSLTVLEAVCSMQPVCLAVLDTLVAACKAYYCEDKCVKQHPLLLLLQNPHPTATAACKRLLDTGMCNPNATSLIPVQLQGRAHQGYFSSCSALMAAFGFRKTEALAHLLRHPDICVNNTSMCHVARARDWPDELFPALQAFRTTLLVAACAAQDVGLVQTLLSDFDVCAPNEGPSALEVAWSHRNETLVALLLAATPMLGLGRRRWHFSASCPPTHFNGIALGKVLSQRDGRRVLALHQTVPAEVAWTSPGVPASVVAALVERRALPVMGVDVFSARQWATLLRGCRSVAPAKRAAFKGWVRGWTPSDHNTLYRRACPGLDLRLWALCCAVARWNNVSTNPPLPPEVVHIFINLALLTKQA